MNKKIRKSAVAGQFYTANKEELKGEMDVYLKMSGNFSINGDIRAIIVPHAGYIYSGQVAVSSFKLVKNKNIKTVFLISNAHVASFNGIAIDDCDVWETPLGQIEVDKEKGELIIKQIGITANFNSDAHKDDHVIEVQLPFLQTILGDGFKIVPILFGNSNQNSYKELAKALSRIITVDDLVVISSDMSHYPSYADANKIDKKTLNIIEEKDIVKLEDHIKDNEKIVPGEETLLCGIDAIKTIIELGKILNWETKILKYANSGDKEIGDKEKVVGYGALVFFKKMNNNKVLSAEQKNELLEIAKNTIKSYALNKTVPKYNVIDERLNINEGAFVTLYKNRQLRGCIGQIIPGDEPLWKVVQNMAVEAAFGDPRFKPVVKEEFDDLDYEISVLSPPEKIDDWRKIELGKHGVIVKKGFKTGVFLPQVAKETGWNLEEFLGNLCTEKAGLNSECFKNDKDVELYNFTAQVFK